MIQLHSKRYINGTLMMSIISVESNCVLAVMTCNVKFQELIARQESVYQSIVLDEIHSLCKGSMQGAASNPE